MNEWTFEEALGQKPASPKTGEWTFEEAIGSPTVRPPGALPVEPAFSREIAATDVPLGSVGRGIESGGALLGRGAGGLVEHLEAGGPGGYIARKVLGEKVGGTLGRIGGYALTPLAKIVGGVSRLAGGGVDEALAGDTGRTTTGYFKQAGESIGERQAKFDPGAYSFQLSQGAVSTVPSLVAAPAGLTGMAIAAGTQVFGNTLADAADAYEKQGMTRQQAMDKAAPWALLDGLQTALLTRLVPGGESAIASVFRKEGAAAAQNFGEQVIKNYFKNSVARMGARVAKEGALEGVEEAMNQALSGAIAKWSYAPEKSWEQIWEETKLGGSLGIALGGMMGGAWIVLGGREQAQPEIPPPVQPEPETGPLPITPRTRNRIEPPVFESGQVPVPWMSGLVPRDTIFETPRLAPPDAPVQTAAPRRTADGIRGDEGLFGQVPGEQVPSPVDDYFMGRSPEMVAPGGEMPVMPTFGETLPQPSTQPTEPYASTIRGGEKVVPKARLQSARGEKAVGDAVEQAASRQPEPVAARAEGEAAKAPELMTPEEFDSHKPPNGLVEPQRLGFKVEQYRTAGNRFPFIADDPKTGLSWMYYQPDDSWVPNKTQDVLIRGALSSNKPVNAKAISDFGIELPSGYIRSGDQYVYQPTKQPAVEPPERQVIPNEEKRQEGLQVEQPSGKLSGVSGAIPEPEKNRTKAEVLGSTAPEAVSISPVEKRLRQVIGDGATDALIEARAAWKIEKDYEYRGLERLRDTVALGLNNTFSFKYAGTSVKVATDLIEGRKTLLDKLINLEPIKESEIDNLGTYPSVITRFGYERGDKKIYTYEGKLKPAVEVPGEGSASLPPQSPTQLPPVVSIPKSRLPSGRRTGKLPAALKKEAATPEPVKQKQGFDTKAAKEQKRYLLEEVDKAIADAPETRAVVPADADMAALDDVRMAKAGEDFVKFGERERATVEALANKYGVPWDKEKSGSSAIGQAYTKTKFNEVEGKIQDAILKQSDTILIAVPGDGKFTLFNSKAALNDFKERAKRFPTTAPKQSFPSKPRLTPTTVPPTGKMVAENIAKAAALSISMDDGRGAIRFIYSDGKVTVATDGRRLIQIDKGLGGTPENPKLFREDGKPLSKAEIEEVGQFPNWKQVVPLEENLFAAFKGLDIERLNNVLQQATQATSERQNSVNLYRNPDGSIAVTSATTDFGDYQHNLQDGAKILGAYHPKYLVDAIKAAKILGNEKVDIWYTDDRAPVVIKSNGVKVIIMPMKVDGGVDEKNILARSDIEGKKPSKRKAEKLVEQPTPSPKSKTLTMNDVAAVRNLSDSEIAALADPVVYELRQLKAIGDARDSAGIADRGGNVYDEALEGKFTREQLAAARIVLRDLGASNRVIDAIEGATVRDVVTEPETTTPSVSPEMLLKAAAKYRVYGPDYDRNIAESANRLENLSGKGSKFLGIAVNELKMRLERWHPEALAQPAAPAAAQPTVTPSAIKTESVNRAEIVTVGKGENVPKNTDFVMAVSSARNYFTLWFRSLEPGKRQDWRYVTILGRDQSEAHQRAQSAAERIASGDLTGLAFIGKEQLKVPKKIALLTYELTGDELMGVERTSIGEQAVGFGKHANILVKDLFRLQPDYAIWLVGNANFSRGRQIANYISALPEFIVSRDAKKVAAQEAVTGDNEEALKANKMSASANEVGTITLGGNTYDWKEQIKADGGRFDANNKAWYFAEPEQFTKFAERLRGITATSGGQGDRPAAYLANPRLRGLREAAKQSPDQSGFDKPIESYIGDETASLLRRGKGMGIPDVVIDEQVEDAARINRAYQLGKRLFLLTSEPGSGKTFVLGAAIRELKKSGAKNIVYVTLRQELITQIKEDLKAFGIDDVKFITYPALREMSPQSTDVLIFDEAHSVKNVGRDGDSAQQAAKAAQWIKQSKYTIFATATPFENPVQAEYLEPTGVFSDTFGDFMSFAEAFGASRYKLKSGNEVLVWKRRPSSDQDQSDARDWIRKQGIFTARRIRLPQGMVDSRLVNTQADPKIAEIYRQFTEAAEDNEDELVPFGKMWIKNFQKRLLESAKVSLGIVEAEAALKRGRNPIIFVETKAEREIDIPDLISKEAEWEQDVAMALKNNERPPPRSQYGLPPQGVVDVLRTFMEKTGMQKILIPSAEDLIVNHFGEGKVAIFTGSVTPAKAQKNLDDWRAGRKKIIVATMAKGGTGLSLHDKVGNHPTTQININLPWTATQVVQVAQRSARYGLQSKAEMEWLFADNIPFDRMLSARVGGRMADMGAVVHGARLEGSERIENWDFENSLFSDDKQAAAQAPAVIPEKPTTPPAEPPTGQPPLRSSVQKLGYEKTPEETNRNQRLLAKRLDESGQVLRTTQDEVNRLFSDAGERNRRVLSQRKTSRLPGPTVGGNLRPGTAQGTPGVFEKTRVFIEGPASGARDGGGRSVAGEDVLAARILFGTYQATGKPDETGLFIQKLFARLLNLKVVFRAMGEGETHALWTRDQDWGYDLIAINTTHSQKYNFNDPQVRESYDAQLIHELVHALANRVATKSELTAVWKSLSPDEQAKVQQVYRRDQKTDNAQPMDENQWGNEYIRMLFEERLFGKPSEFTDASLSKETKNILRSAINYLKQIFGAKPTNNIAKEIIARLEGAIKGDAPIAQPVVDLTIEPPASLATNIEGAGNENFEGEKSSLSKGMEPGVAQDMESTRTGSGEILWATKGEIAQILLNPSERAGRGRRDSGTAQGTQRTPEKIRVLIEKPEASMPLSGVRQAAATLLANRIVSGLGSSEAKTETREGHFFKLLVNKLTGLKFVIREFGPLPNGQPDITPAMYQADELGRFDVVSININQIGNIAESKELQALWDSMLIEEVIHAAASRLATRPEIEQVWNKLSDEERAKVNEFYDQEKTLDKPLDAFNGGHEYIRIILQERLAGRPTELSKFSISDVAKNILRKLLSELKSLFGAKPKNDFAREVIDRIEGAIKGEPPIPQPVVGLRDYAIEETAPTWYSRITRTVEQSPQNKASGSQWKAMIRNSKLGVSKDEYALVSVDDLEDGRTYTKAEVLDYLRANEVKVEDVTLGETSLTVVQHPTKPEGFALQKSDGSYILNGPQTTRPNEPTFWDRRDYAENYGLKAYDENAGKFSTYQLPGGKEGSYREVLLTVPKVGGDSRFTESDILEQAKVDAAGQGMLWGNLSRENQTGYVDAVRERFGASPVWQDGHSQYSDIANPIVRLRFNERTTADGKRMLFLEEVQAPQKGQFEKMPALFQKNWREIAFKWALRHAAENGFNQVGWTTGEMQAERYDLSKQVDSINAIKRPNGTYYLNVKKNGESQAEHDVNSDAQLAEFIGKDLASKISSQPADGKIVKYTGVDLKVGGEGLKKLYDVDFRNVVNGLPVVKKSGQKVGIEKIPDSESFTTESFSDFIRRTGLSRESATERYMADRKTNLPGEEFTVQSITITPEMRDAVMAGQNMFSKANQSPAGWVEIEGNQPLTEADVRAAVDPILSNWQGVTFNLVNDPNWTSGEDSLIGGMRSGNEITLNLAAIGSKERAVALLLHEGVGHLGIRGALGTDFVRVMDEVWNMMTPENHAEVVKLVKRYGSDRTNLTAEWVARQAEKGATGSTWKRIWQRVMDWFAKVFGRQNAEAIARDLFRQGSKWLRTNPDKRVEGKADFSIEEATRAVETGGQANVPFARRQAGAELVAAPFVRERLAEVTRIANDPNADQAQADSAKALLKNKTARKLLFGPAQKLEELEGNMGATVQTYEQSRQNPNLQPTEFQTVTLAALNSYNEFQKGVAEFLAGIEQQREAIIEMISKGRKKLGDIFTPGTKEYQKFVNRQSANQITDILEDGVNHAATAVARETTRRVVQHKVAVQNAVVWILNNVPDWRTFTNPAELLAQVKETAGADWMQAVGANAENTADAAFMLLTFAKQFEAVMATREAAMNITTAEAEQHQLEMEAVKADLLSGNVNQAIRRYRRAIEKMAAKSSKAAEAIKMLRRKEDNLINELEGLNRMQELVTAIRQDPAYRTLGEHLAEDTHMRAPIDNFDEANDTVRLTAFPGQPEVVIQIGPSKEAAHKAFEAVNAYSQNALRYLANKDSNPDYDPFLGRSLAFFLENRAEILKSRGLLPENPGLLPAFAFQLFKHGADFVFNSSTIPYFIKFFGRGLGFDRLSETIEAGSKIQKLAQRVYELMYPKSDRLLYEARTAHGIPTIGEYWEKVFNRLAYSRQYHQLKALKVGDPIGNGYRVTQADLDVLNDQVAFHQGLAAAIRSQQGVAGAVSQGTPQARGIKEESPNLHFYFRDALATGPQTLSRNFGRVFRWLEQMDAGRNLEQFVNQHADTLLFGYINWANEATNLNTRYKYAAELKDIQRESLADNEPVQSVDELAQLIYDAKVKEAEDAEEEIEIPTVAEIKHTILGEIDTMLRRVRDYREALRQELTDPGEQKFALTSGVSSLTKARGDMIMPGEWYDYGTLGKDTMLAQVSNASKPSFIEMAKLLNAMVRKLQAKVDELERSGLTEQQLRERRKAGEDFMSADEAREALSQLKKIQTWLGKIEANHGNIETRSFGGIGRMDNNWRVVMRLATAAALTKGASMINNLFGGGFMTAFLRTNLDIPSQSIADFADGSIVTSSAWGSFRSIPASYAALRDLVKTTAERTTLTMTEMLAYMTGKAATKSQIKAIQKMNEYVTASLLEQRRQWQLFQEIGLDSNIQLRERFLNYLRLFETGGESIDTIKELGPARAKPKGLLARLARHPAQAFKAGALAASEGMGQLGVSWVDSVINKFAGGRIAADYELLMQALAHQTMPAKVQAAEQGGYDWRDTSRQENFWTPSEIAHNKGVDAEKVGLGRRDLVRQTGATWEQLMTDYWSRYTDWVQGGKQGTPPRFLKNDAQRNGLMVAIANRTNYSDFSNRPMSSHAGGMQEFAGYLYGWPMWAAQEMAAAFGAPSNRTTKQLRPDITSLSTMTQLMSLAIPMAILSMMAMTLRDYYSDLYKKYKIKALSPRYLAEKALAGEPIDPVVAAKITASSMANFIPFFGAVMNNWLDNASRNGYDLNSQIFGLNLANDMYNTIREVGETGDPIYSLLRFGSRWLLPDTAVRAMPSVLPIEATRTLEGALGNRTANNIAAQAASLADIENRRNMTGQSTFRYTEATPLIRGWLAAMATGDDASRADFFNRLVEQKRADIIAKHPEIDPGQADTDARAAALSSLRSRHPFVTALGRMPTEQEYNTMMGKLTPENREKLTAYMAGYDRAIQQDSGGTATVRSFTAPSGGSVTTFRSPAGGGGVGLGASGSGGRLPSGGLGGQRLPSASGGAGMSRISDVPAVARPFFPRLGRFNVARRVAAAPRTRLPRLRLTRLKLPKLSARLKRPRLPRSGGRLLAMKKPRLRRTTLV